MNTSSSRRCRSLSVSRQMIVAGLFLGSVALVQGVHHEKVERHHLAVADLKLRNKANIQRAKRDDSVHVPQRKSNFLLELDAAEGTPSITDGASGTTTIIEGVDTLSSHVSSGAGSVNGDSVVIIGDDCYSDTSSIASGVSGHSGTSVASIASVGSVVSCAPSVASAESGASTLYCVPSDLDSIWILGSNGSYTVHIPHASEFSSALSHLSKNISGIIAGLKKEFAPSIADSIECPAGSITPSLAD